MAKESRLTFKDVRADVRDTRQLAWPITERPFTLMLLRASEVQAAHFAAVDYFVRKNQPMDGPSFQEFMREKEAQEVYRMMLEPDCSQPASRLFKSAEDVKGLLDLEEIAWIQDEHRKLARHVLRERGILIKLEDEETQEDDDAR
jgi:hypothetical protein